VTCRHPALRTARTAGTINYELACGIESGPARARRTVPGPIGRLDDPSAIVRAWAVSGLCLIARRFDGFDGDILPRLRRRERDQSIAVRHRAATAVGLLLDPSKPIPKSWVKGPAEATAPRRRRSRRA